MNLERIYKNLLLESTLQLHADGGGGNGNFVGSVGNDLFCKILEGGVIGNRSHFFRVVEGGGNSQLSNAVLEVGWLGDVGSVVERNAGEVNAIGNLVLSEMNHDQVVTTRDNGRTAMASTR